MKKKIFICVLCVWTAFVSFGCQSNKDDVIYMRPSNEIDITDPVILAEPLDPQIQALLEKSSVSEAEAYQIMGYSHRTDEGIRYYRRALDSGYLSFTLHNVRILGSGDTWPLENYVYDAYFGYNQAGEWVKFSRPADLNSDGTCKPGWNLVLVDLTVTSHNATARIGDYSKSDPYLFTADITCTLADLRYFGDYNCQVRNVDYFSKMGEYPEHPMLYRVAPGESISFTVGFLVPPWGRGELEPLEYLRLSNAYGNHKGVFLRLDEEGLSPCS